MRKVAISLYVIILSLGVYVFINKIDTINRLETIESIQFEIKDELKSEMYKLHNDSINELLQLTNELDKLLNVSVEISNDGNFKYLGKFECTAYDDSPESQEQWVGQTATGRIPQVGVIAVDPKVIPLNSRLYVEGYGFCVAGDTGGAIKGNRLDLFFNTNDEVYNFGRRKLDVFIVN